MKQYIHIFIIIIIILSSCSNKPKPILKKYTDNNISGNDKVIKKYLRTSYFYDENGNITSTIKLCMKYNEYGAVIEEPYHNGILKYKYDSKNDLIRWTAYDSSNNILWDNRYEYTYDRNNKLLKKVVYDKDNNISFKTLYKYNRAGNLIKVLDKIDKDIARYKYDKNGIIKEWINISNDFRSDASFTYKIKYYFDNENDILETVKYKLFLNVFWIKIEKYKFKKKKGYITGIDGYNFLSNDGLNLYDLDINFSYDYEIVNLKYYSFFNKVDMEKKYEYKYLFNNDGKIIKKIELGGFKYKKEINIEYNNDYILVKTENYDFPGEISRTIIDIYYKNDELVETQIYNQDNILETKMLFEYEYY